MSSLVAFYDANVFYPAELRSFLMYLATTGLFRAKWSAVVHEEWISNLLKNRPDLSREKLERTRRFIDESVLDGLVTGYEDLIPSLTLPDPDDRHVLAAAIRGRADTIVTMNLRDFPKESLSPYGIKAQHPDHFVRSLLNESPTTVLTAAQEHRAAMNNPSKEIEEYLEILKRQGLTRSVSILQAWMF